MGYHKRDQLGRAPTTLLHFGKNCGKNWWSNRNGTNPQPENPFSHTIHHHYGNFSNQNQKGLRPSKRGTLHICTGSHERVFRTLPDCKDVRLGNSFYTYRIYIIYRNYQKQRQESLDYAERIFSAVRIHTLFCCNKRCMHLSDTSGLHNEI